jgi:hypothetical protein
MGETSRRVTLKEQSEEGRVVAVACRVEISRSVLVLTVTMSHGRRLPQGSCLSGELFRFVVNRVVLWEITRFPAYCLIMDYTGKIKFKIYSGCIKLLVILEFMF